MSEPIKIIVNGDEINERPYTENELKQLEKDKAQNEAFNAEMLPKENLIKNQRKALLDKLGLTEDEAKLLLS